MTRTSWLVLVLFIAIGLGLGLFYGWALSPVQYVDTTPSTLRADYQTDYTLMVAETFQHDHNLENAARHLALLGSQPPSQIAIEALGYARQYQFNTDDITLLQELSAALIAGQSNQGIPAGQAGGKQP